MTVHIDRDLCAGTAACVRWLPQVFGLDDDEGLATVLDPTAAPEDEIVACAGSCPTAAISVTRGDTTLVG